MHHRIKLQLDVAFLQMMLELRIDFIALLGSEVADRAFHKL